MKKYAVIAVALVCALTVATTVKLSQGGGCPPPVTKLLALDTSAAQTAVDKWVAVTAASYTHSASVGWGIDKILSYKPGEIDAVIVVGNGYDPSFGLFLGDQLRFYRVTLTRSCAGGGWVVADAHRARLHLPPAVKHQAKPTAAPGVGAVAGP